MEAAAPLRLPRVPLPSPAPLRSYVLDFFEPSLALDVEIDGEMHVAERDAARDAWMKANRVTVLRLPAREVLADVEGAADHILAVARSPLSQLR